MATSLSLEIDIKRANKRVSLKMQIPCLTVTCMHMATFSLNKSIVVQVSCSLPFAICILPSLIIEHNLHDEWWKVKLRFSSHERSLQRQSEAVIVIILILMCVHTTSSLMVILSLENYLR